MNLRSLSVILVLGLVAAFAALNWTAFTTPATISLLFTTVEAPLGLIMLAVTGALAALFLVFMLYLQTSVFLEARRHSRELQSQRALADQAEASRFTELRAYLEKELKALRAALDSDSAGLNSRIEAMEQTIKEELAQATNTLAAYIGEVEDRLDRGEPSGGPAR